MDKLPAVFTVKPTKGKGRGKKLGIPTLNFFIPQSLTLPHGVYAGWLITEDKKYKSAIHFGPRPQFGETDPSLEAYLLDGVLNSIPTDTNLVFTRFIRQIRSFSTVKAMLAQIKQDVREITNYLSTSKTPYHPLSK